MRLAERTVAVIAITLLSGCSARAPGFTQDAPVSVNDSGSGDAGTIDDLAVTDSLAMVDSANDGGIAADMGSNPDDVNPADDTGASPDDVPTTGFDVPPFDAGFDQPDAYDAGPLPPLVDVLAPGAPANAPTRFAGPDTPSRAPSLVYPTDGTIVPPNLNGFEVHFMPGPGNDVFEVAFVGATSTIRVYTNCTSVGGGCVLALDTSTYSLIARAAQDSGHVTITVRGAALAGTGAFGRSAARTLGVTSEALRGGVYYWSALAGNIMRYEFGLPGARPEVYMPGGGPFACLGCHTLSRDGSRAAVGRFIPQPSQMQTYDVATRGALGAVYGSNFATFSPDNARLLTSDGAHLALIDAATGAAATGLAAGTVGSMPDWSPDGTQVVFARPASVPPFFGTPGHSAPADLMLMRWNGAAFATATSLVHAAAMEDNYYPCFSPDGRWVLFNRNAGDSYNSMQAHLWAVPSDASAAPRRLAASDTAVDAGNSWPKWAPFVQSYQGQPLMWFSFTSRRDYGLRLQQASVADDMKISQLWMAAFLPGQASTDASAPAFWLPIQSLSEGNHIAQWTQHVQRHACTTNADCATNEHCVSNNFRVPSCVGN